MNPSHSKLAEWGLAQIPIESHYTILDVGCGGGRTVGKLAAIAAQGKVYGIDYSAESVAATKRMNARWLESGRVEVRRGSVSKLPFPDGMFDLVTAVETHFWWPDLPGDMREVFRVTKPGGTLILIAEIYKGANTTAAKLAEKYASRTGPRLPSVQEHRELCENAGLTMFGLWNSDTKAGPANVLRVYLPRVCGVSFSTRGSPSSRARHQACRTPKLSIAST